MKKIYLLLFVIIIYGCQTDENLSLIEEENSLSSNKVHFKDLPSYIQNFFSTNELEKSSTVKSKTKTVFGNPKKTVSSKKFKNDIGLFSYTIPLKKISRLDDNGDFYFDNMVINEIKDNKAIVQILRYKPTIQWSSSNNKELEPYSGSIEIYNLKGQLLGKMKMENGNLYKEKDVNKGWEETCYLEYKGYICTGGDCLYKYEVSCTMEYVDELEGGSGGGGTTYTEPTSGGGGGGTSTTSPIPEEEEKEEKLSDPCITTIEDMKKVFPNTDEILLQTVTDLINKHGEKFGIQTKDQLQHFLAQAGHESTNYAGREFSAFEENLNYRVELLGVEYWGKYFNPASDPTANPLKANPLDFRRSPSSPYVNKELFADLVYGSRMGNAGEGYKYRGRGIIQLTGKNNYKAFTEFYQKNYDSSINFIENPDLISSDLEIAVISALWFFQNSVMTKLTIDSETPVIAVTTLVNGGQKGLKHRNNLYEKSTFNIDCL